MPKIPAKLFPYAMDLEMCQEDTAFQWICQYQEKTTKYANIPASIRTTLQTNFDIIYVFTLSISSRAQDRPECLCGAFISTVNGEYEVHRLPPIDTNDCDDEKLCAVLCAAEVGWLYICIYEYVDV